MFEPVFDGRPNRRTPPRLCAWASLTLLSTALAGGGCIGEALPCALQLNPGDLVITEVRGPQDSTDADGNLLGNTRGEWFELHNTTDDTIDLAGLRMEMINLRGSQQVTVLVRQSVPLEAGGYAVLGSLPAQNSPPEVDYSFNGDFQVTSTIDATGGTIILPPGEDDDPRTLFSNARVELFACEQRIDSLVYAELPRLGTYSFDGARDPDADANDDPMAWCDNDTPAEPSQDETESGGMPDDSTTGDEPMASELGLPGSPGEANPPCP
ncbi:MAG: lamin tail domain-containing protein [Deltaproteobacteria bacterium]|nr:lamin tail domain-containing protein [Deltaproteobacteria bacterium]